MRGETNGGRQTHSKDTINICKLHVDMLISEKGILNELCRVSKTGLLFRNIQLAIWSQCCGYLQCINISFKNDSTSVFISQIFFLPS